MNLLIKTNDYNYISYIRELGITIVLYIFQKKKKFMSAYRLKFKRSFNILYNS